MAERQPRPAAWKCIAVEFEHFGAGHVGADPLRPIQDLDNLTSKAAKIPPPSTAVQLITILISD
jgi:hypothetical protein